MANSFYVTVVSSVARIIRLNVCVQMTLSRVIVEMVADGSGHFSPAS